MSTEKLKPNLLDHLCLLDKLDAMVPEGEGAVSLTIYSDGSSRMNLEMWGATVAKKAEGQPFVLDTHAIQTQNPDWMPALEKLVEKLNTRQSK